MYLAVFSHDGELLATSDDTGAVRLWDTTSWQQVGSLTGPPPSADGVPTSVTALGFRPGDRLIVAGYDDGTLWSWDPSTQAVVGAPIAAQGSTSRSSAAVSSLAFSPDGKVVAAAGADGQIGLWDPDSRRSVRQLHVKGKEAVTSLAFSPDGRILAAGTGVGGAVQLWDPSSGTPIADPMVGHPGVAADVSVSAGGGSAVSSLAFSPDGRTLASAELVGNVRLWNSWDPLAACDLAAPFVESSQVTEHLPVGWPPSGCTPAR